ncbi:sodium channel protein 60E-like [Drosophila nasuta]|uniref:sodium channel protein 60E-like n=1 Tax=Drosophila nasuta TaxID=42062 RepID=UPI00295EB3D4|nr:sodium channel protein 60E-like [Drosophila nasuta]
MDSCLMPTVQIMVDSPKEPPRGDFSMDSGFANAPTTPAIDVDTPIDVNVQGDTSQVFYDYNPESNVVHTTDMAVTIEEGEQQTHAPVAEVSACIDDQQR